MPDVTGLPALDVLIGLIVLLFFFSVVTASVNEVIQAVVNARGAYLSRGIRTLLEDDKDATTKFFAHWRIKRLTAPPSRARRLVGRPERFIKDRRRPSYLPARAFALAVLDTANPGAPPTLGAKLFWEAQSTIDRIGIPSPEGGTTSALGAAEQRQDALRTELERAFDEVMARTSGWYRRYVQWWLILLAVAVAFGLNVNSFTVAERLWKDGAVRPAVSQQAQEKPDAAAKDVATDIDTIPALQLPIGWGETNPGPLDGNFGDFCRWLAGCLVIAAALALGAPFWFDVLTNFSHLRTTGAREGDLRES